jgi:hypothetical protein
MLTFKNTLYNAQIKALTPLEEQKMKEEKAKASKSNTDEKG